MFFNDYITAFYTNSVPEDWTLISIPDSFKLDDALSIADKLITKTGLDYFSLSKAVYCCVSFDHSGTQLSGFNPHGQYGWYLHYLRNIDGVSLDNDDIGFDYNGVFRSALVNEHWKSEQLNIFITSEGIQAVDYESPLILLNSAPVKGLSDKELIKALNNILIDKYSSGKNDIELQIDKLELRYIRINSETACQGSILPVWIVTGTMIDNTSGSNGDIRLFVNAANGDLVEGLIYRS